MQTIEESSDRVGIEAKAPSRVRAFLLEIVQTVALTLVIFLAVRALVQNFRVEGASMEPTLHSGQYLLINKLTYLRPDELFIAPLLPGELRQEGYLFGGPRRGDVVVFRSPTQGQKDFIKRVVAVPGDEVRIVRGTVYVNGQPLEEPYVTRQAHYDFPPNGQPLRVPPGHYFVLGDNRPNSSDSHLGWTVAGREILGKAWLSYWPPSEWQVLQDGAYANLGR